MFETRKVLWLALIALVAGAAQAAPVPDLTGTWIGTQVCDDLSDGERVSFVLTDNIAEISQDGDRIRMAKFGFLYEGIVQGTGPKAGEAAIASCGGEFEVTEVVRIENVRVGPGSDGAWEAISVFFTEDEAFGTIFSDCKYAYERISDEDPNVPACP